MPGVYISELAGIQCSIEHTPTVEKIEELHLKSGYMSQIHQHPDAAELMFIDRGAGSIRVREENYPVHEGDLVVYNAGEFHREVFLRSGDPPCVYALRLQKLHPRLSGTHPSGNADHPGSRGEGGRLFSARNRARRQRDGAAGDAALQRRERRL